jgi:F0F1-type ATP synthase membrane subunit c/vacuolar-type H+-ATPase subunit K
MVESSAAAAGNDAVALLRATRGLSVTAAVFLALQLFGNLYEQLVSNVAMIARPRVGALVGELVAGSPVYYYLPWAPLGVLLVAVLAVRLPRLGAPGWVVRRVRGALAALGVAVAVKIVLIAAVNPRFRDPGSEVETVRGWAVTWAFGNGAAVLAVATALVLLLSWRARVLDLAAGADADLRRR